MNEEPLPGMPRPDPRPPTAARPGIRAVRSHSRRLCEMCCQRVHDEGVGVAPYPMPAKWRVWIDDTAYVLCYLHKQEVVS